MKHLLLFALLIITSTVVAQSNDNLSRIDTRALSHYTEAEILQMDEVTLQQVNFIFRSSWVVNTDKPCDVCPNLDTSNFDVLNYTRQTKSRARVYLTNPGHPIDLLTHLELDAELARIKNEVETNTQSN